MKRWLLCSLTMVGIFMLSLAQLDAYEVANGFIFPKEGYVEDGTGAWGVYRNGNRHVGDDYGLPLNDLIRTIGKGRVKYILNDPDNLSGHDWYNVIVMEHALPDDSTICAIYGHAESLAGIEVGQDINKAGVALGKIAIYPPNGTHIHFGIYNGEFGGEEGEYPVWLAGYLPPAQWPGDYLQPIDYVEAHLLKHPVLDTGQTQCFDNTQAIACPSAGNAFYGQDYQTQGMSHGYEDNGDGTITISGYDKVLMWEKGDTQNNSVREWSPANTYCQESTLGDYDDWRLPTFRELTSLLKFDGSTGPFINASFFPNAKSNYYWTATETGYNSNRVAIVGFNYGILISALKSADYYVRCVRGDGVPKGSFTDNADGTVTDATTGLTWEQADDGTSRTWEGALAYCEDLTIEQRSNWRLPDILKLVSIMETNRYDPAADPVFTFTVNNMKEYWSSTTDTKYPNNAWMGGFKYGVTTRMYKPDTSSSHFVRCVHD